MSAIGEMVSSEEMADTASCKEASSCGDSGVTSGSERSLQFEEQGIVGSSGSWRSLSARESFVVRMYEKENLASCHVFVLRVRTAGSAGGGGATLPDQTIQSSLQSLAGQALMLAASVRLEKHQHVFDAMPNRLTDVEIVEKASGNSGLMKIVEENCHEVFDVTNGPLWRVVYVKRWLRHRDRNSVKPRMSVRDRTSALLFFAHPIFADTHSVYQFVCDHLLHFMCNSSHKPAVVQFKLGQMVPVQLKPSQVTPGRMPAQRDSCGIEAAFPRSAEDALAAKQLTVVTPWLSRAIARLLQWKHRYLPSAPKSLLSTFYTFQDVRDRPTRFHPFAIGAGPTQDMVLVCGRHGLNLSNTLLALAATALQAVCQATDVDFGTHVSCGYHLDLRPFLPEETQVTQLSNMADLPQLIKFKLSHTFSRKQFWTTAKEISVLVKNMEERRHLHYKQNGGNNGVFAALCDLHTEENPAVWQAVEELDVAAHFNFSFLGDLQATGVREHSTVGTPVMVAPPAGIEVYMEEHYFTSSPANSSFRPLTHAVSLHRGKVQWLITHSTNWISTEFVTKYAAQIRDIAREITLE